MPMVLPRPTPDLVYYGQGGIQCVLVMLKHYLIVFAFFENKFKGMSLQIKSFYIFFNGSVTFGIPYTCPVWHPYRQGDKLNKIQRAELQTKKLVVVLEDITNHANILELTLTCPA